MFGKVVSSLSINITGKQSHDSESTLISHRTMWFTPELETLHYFCCVRINEIANGVLHDVINRLYNTFFTFEISFSLTVYM
jgi:hypothetical protein